MADVIQFPGITTGPVPVAHVLDSALEQAKQAGLDEVIVLGRYADGRVYYASSEGDSMRMLWAVEQFKRRLMARFDEVEGSG